MVQGVHVTFNEKVECHQYSPTRTGAPPSNGSSNDGCVTEGVPPTSVREKSRIRYTQDFLLGLRDAPLSKVCPAFMNKAIKDGQPIPYRPVARSVFTRSSNTNTQNSRRHFVQNFVPYFSNNYQYNHGRLNQNELFEPIEPIGSSRYSSQRRNHQNRNPMADNYPYNGGGLLPDFVQRYDQRPASGTKNEEETPEWYLDGPTSMNDCVELHGFPGNPDNHENHNRNGHIDANISGGPTSADSSNSGSPPAKSTPAKVTFSASNDAHRHKRYDAGRNMSWQNNYDNNRQSGNAPLLNELFKNYSEAQNQANLRGLTPIANVQDIESSLLYERLKFKQMVAQMQNQTLCRNLMYPLHETVPTAMQILSEIDKILQKSNDPVYKRPEVRALTKNIVEAVIPPINIMNLLKNPLTEPHNRETIQAALKLITQAKENAVKAMKNHTPTESELRAHMDAIMQDAIIKKRMENLNNELMKAPYQQGGRNFRNQAFNQMFRPNAAGRFENHSQGDSRGQFQSFENGTTPSQENNLNRWFSPTLLNKGLIGELPKIPTEPLRSEELETKYKRTLKGNEKPVK